VYTATIAVVKLWACITQYKSWFWKT